MWQEWAFYFVSPLTVAWLLGIAALCLRRLKHPKAALALACMAFGGLWLASTPAVSDLGMGLLEDRYRPVTPQATPAGDVIVILGGAVIPAYPPWKPTLSFGPASGRVWHAAQLYKAGKAKWIVIAAGAADPRPGQQIEAEAIHQVLVELQVPPTAILRETLSRNTRENARFALPMVKQLGGHRVLLVTSAQHMIRAMRTFEAVFQGSGVEIIPCVTDVRWAPKGRWSWKVWLPSPDALISVTSSLKEFAGLAALEIIGVTD